MQSGQPEMGDQGMTEKIASTASQAGRTALNKIDETRQNAAGSLESAANKVHEAAEAGGQRVSSAMHSAAQGLESTATFLREYDTKRVMGDITDLVRKYPGASLLIAAGVGFLTARALQND